MINSERLMWGNMWNDGDNIDEFRGRMCREK